MTERYDGAAAAHYAAYRPPLHRMILGRVIAGESFAVGLDVGCGTGQSAIALAPFCARVYGVDPSASMLREATGYGRVRYVRASAGQLPFANRSVDVVTFAGSLFYANTDATRDEIERISRDATVVVYDFEVLLDDIMKRVGVDVPAVASNYDHRVNFSGTAGFGELTAGSDRVTVPLTAAELAHVLLADSHRLDGFSRAYRKADPFDALLTDLQATRTRASIEVDIYYSKYRLA